MVKNYPLFCESFPQFGQEDAVKGEMIRSEVCKRLLSVHICSYCQVRAPYRVLVWLTHKYTCQQVRLHPTSDYIFPV